MSSLSSSTTAHVTPTTPAASSDSPYRLIYEHVQLGRFRLYTGLTALQFGFWTWLSVFELQRPELDIPWWTGPSGLLCASVFFAMLRLHARRYIARIELTPEAMQMVAPVSSSSSFAQSGRASRGRPHSSTPSTPIDIAQLSASTSSSSWAPLLPPTAPVRITVHNWRGGLDSFVLPLHEIGTAHLNTVSLTAKAQQRKRTAAHWPVRLSGFRGFHLIDRKGYIADVPLMRRIMGANVDLGAGAVGGAGASASEHMPPLSSSAGSPPPRPQPLPPRVGSSSSNGGDGRRR